MGENHKKTVDEKDFWEACYHCAKISMSGQSLGKTLPKICEVAVGVTDACRGSIMLLSQDGTELEVAAAVNIPRNVWKKIRISVNDTNVVAGWVAKHKKPLFLEDITADPRFCKATTKKSRYTNHSLISVPLMSQRKLLGVFNVSNKEHGEDFTKEDRDVMIRFAKELSLLIAHLHMVDRLSVRAEKLDEAYQKMIEGEELKKELTRMIIHDLKAPLGEVEQALMLYQTLQKSGVPDVELIDASLNGCYTLKRRILDILDIERVESGSLKLFCEDFNVLDVVEEVVKGMQSTAQERGIEISMKDVDEDLIWVADVEFLQRVLTNLIMNAISHASEGKRIILSFSQEDEETLHFQVEDFGKGIPAGMEEKIFDKFFLLSPSKGGTSGSGLGLAFCRLAVTAHGGDIRVENKPEGSGCIFHFTFRKQEKSIA